MRGLSNLVERFERPLYLERGRPARNERVSAKTDFRRYARLIQCGSLIDSLAPDGAAGRDARAPSDGTMQFLTKINSLYDAALTLMYPQACAVCEVRSVEAQADLPACAECWQATRIFNAGDLMCWKCSAPLDSDARLSEEQRSAIRCHGCDEESFTAARAVGVYEGALRASVLSLKRAPFVGARLARLLLETQLRSPLDKATRIVPVPLAAERERERGFNQATILARALAARHRLPIDEWSLTRTVHTPMHRAEMDARARRESVDDAFRVARPRLIEGEKILLVDDVLTTGATASACARALTKAGAKEVFVLTVARAI